MISRSTSLAIAEAYTSKFSYVGQTHRGQREEKVNLDQIYDFFYSNEYEAWFCNLAAKYRRVRELKEWFMKIHTGESFVPATKDWPWDRRAKLGQEYLKYLARDYLKWWLSNSKTGYVTPQRLEYSNALIRRLELDGYIFRDGRLLEPNQDVLDVEHETNILKSLYLRGSLAKSDEAFSFLSLSEDHFVAGRWSDSISNSRKFFELTLKEGATALGKVRSTQLAPDAQNRPVEVRQYLEREGLLEKKERESIDKIYGLLSETGAHPYMAESDQARLLRQLTLTLMQFVLLRLVAAVAVSTR